MKRKFIIRIIYSIRKGKDSILLGTDKLLELTQIASTREVLLDFLLKKFKKEILASLEEEDGVLLDLFEIYCQFISFFSKLFEDPIFVENEFRKAICQFVDEQLVPRIYYK